MAITSMGIQGEARTDIQTSGHRFSEWGPAWGKTTEWEVERGNEDADRIGLCFI